MGTGSRICVGISVGLAVAVVLSISLIATSLKRINSYEVGLKYNTFTKSLAEEPSYEGLHAGAPGFKFIKFTGVFTTMDFSRIRCLNLDGVSIYLDVSFQYRLKPQDLHSVVMQFKNEEGYKNVIYSIGLSAIHDICSAYNTSQFQTHRGQFQEDLGSRMVSKLNTVSCEVTDIQVIDIGRPQRYETAIRNKEAAREDIEVALSERPRKLTEAGTVKREAETQALIIIDKANSDARIMITQANNEAYGILNSFQQEAATYSKLIADNELTIPGFMSYLGTRVLSRAEQSVQVAMDAPARVSYKDGLTTN